jgi:hypothetical protein
MKRRPLLSFKSCLGRVWIFVFGGTRLTQEQKARLDQMEKDYGLLLGNKVPLRKSPTELDLGIH